MCSWYCVLPGLKLVVMSELKEFGPIVVQWGTISSYRSGLGVTTGKRREEVSVDAFTASVTSELVHSFHEGKHASSVFISWPDWLFDSDVQTARPIARQVLLTFIFQVPALSRSPTVISQMVLCNETSGAVFFKILPNLPHRSARPSFCLSDVFSGMTRPAWVTFDHSAYSNHCELIVGNALLLFCAARTASRVCSRT